MVKLLSTFVLCSLVLTRAGAQGTNPPSPAAPLLGLAEARQAAFERNWDLLAAHSGMDAAAAQLLVAKEFPNPSLALSAVKLGNRQAGTVAGNGLGTRNYDSIAAVTQLIEIGGKRHSRQASARAGLTGARARFLDARRSLDQGVTKAYIGVLLAEENAHILTESAHSLHREAEIGLARFRAGDIKESDLKQIQNNEAQFDLQAKAAETAATQARIMVELLLGVPRPTGGWTPRETLAGLAQSSPAAVAAAALNGAARPDVWAAEADLKRAQADLKLQKAIRIPDPSVTLQVEHNPPGGGPATDTLGLGVSFPLPLWNRNGGAIKAAEANRNQAALAAAKARAQAQADLAAADLEYAEAAARSRRYQDQIRPRSSQVRESIAYAYNKGGASLVDLLTAERDDNNVRLSAAQSLADTAAALADLAAARLTVTTAELDRVK